MKSFTLIFFLAVSNIVFAQNIIKGIVESKSGFPVAFASVVILEKYDSLVIAFAITDKKGFFQIDYNLSADSVFIKVTIIGYEDQLQKIANHSHIINFVLSDHVTELPTVKVQSNSITESGDTINYIVQSFIGKQDRVIGDVIGKMPGIEIDESSGAIKYNGKSITHYYVDGLDLLEKKYNIANRNIPAEMVEQVQVLNNHNDILLFDSLKNFGDAALNLKLKKNARNRFIGRAQAGSGVAPLLFENEITGMRFNKHFQLISSLKNNNTGNALSNELAENITIQRAGDRSEKNIREDIINQIVMPLPGILGKRYLFNNSGLINLNILKVQRNNAQLKTNISYLNDYTANESVINSTYFFPSLPPINFTEKTNSFINSNKIEANIFYTLNTKKKYLKNSVKTKLDFTMQNGTVLNGSHIYQNLKNPFYHFSNDFLMHKPIYKKIISLNSKINFNRLPIQLVVAPGQFKEVLNQSVIYERINQNAVLSNFNTNNSIAFIKKVGRILHEMKIGTEYIFKNLQTNLQKITNGTAIALTDSFKNDLNWYNLRIYGESTTTITKRKKQFSLLLPLELNLLYTKDNIRNVYLNSKNFFFNPYLNAVFPLSSKFTFETDFSIQHYIGNISQISSAYILTDYRRINRNESILPTDRQQNITAAFYYKNQISAFFANFSVSLSENRKNIIYNQFFENSFIRSAAVYFPNSQKSIMLTGTVSKYFIEQKLNLSLNLSSTNVLTDLLQQNNAVKAVTKNYSAGLNTNFTKWKGASFQSNMRFDVFKNELENDTKKNSGTVSYKINENLKLYFFITKNFTLYFNNEYYSVSDNKSVIKRYFFGDIGFKQKFKTTDIQLEWTNYTNNKTYTAITNSLNLTQMNTFKIRPANFLVKFNFMF